MEHGKRAGQHEQVRGLCSAQLGLLWPGAPGAPAEAPAVPGLAGASAGPRGREHVGNYLHIKPVIYKIAINGK